MKWQREKLRAFTVFDFLLRLLLLAHAPLKHFNIILGSLSSINFYSSYTAKYHKIKHRLRFLEYIWLHFWITATIVTLDRQIFPGAMIASSPCHHCKVKKTFSQWAFLQQISWRGECIKNLLCLKYNVSSAEMIICVNSV